MHTLLLTLFSVAAVISFPSSAVADPDGVYKYCEEKLNKRGLYDCGCVLEKYYPKKAELEQAWGVPINDPAIAMMHVTTPCTDTGQTADYEYKSCMSSPTFKTSKTEFGAERFCRCYADEWEKQLSEYKTTKNASLDANVRSHLKTMARATCKRKFR